MMRFIRLEGIAAALPVANLDTDRIIPAAYLSSVSRNGLGAGLLAPIDRKSTRLNSSHSIASRMPSSA